MLCYYGNPSFMLHTYWWCNSQQAMLTKGSTPFVLSTSSYYLPSRASLQASCYYLVFLALIYSLKVIKKPLHIFHFHVHFGTICLFFGANISVLHQCKSSLHFEYVCMYVIPLFYGFGLAFWDISKPCVDNLKFTLMYSFFSCYTKYVLDQWLSPYNCFWINRTLWSYIFNWNFQIIDLSQNGLK